MVEEEEEVMVAAANLVVKVAEARAVAARVKVEVVWAVGALVAAELAVAAKVAAVMVVAALAVV